MTIALAKVMARSTADLSDIGAMARAPSLFFCLELADPLSTKLQWLLLILIFKINKSRCSFVDNGVSEF